MPGTDLNLDLPTLADPFSTIVSKLITAVETIEADLAERVTAGELDITTALSMGGAPLTNVGGVRLSNGLSTVIGTVYMDEELHAVTPAGDVKLTLNGAINVTALGTIGGDYGGANPAAVQYNDAAGEFRFTEATGVWADLVADDLVLKGTNGSVRFGVTADIVGDKTLYVKSLPAVAALMGYDPAAGALIDGRTIALPGGYSFSNTITVGGLDVLAGSINLSAGVVKHAEYSQTFLAPLICVPGAGGVTVGNGPQPNLVVTVGNQVNFHLQPFVVGKRLKKITITGTGDVGGALPTTLIRRLDADGSIGVIYAHTVSSLVGAYNTTFEQTLTITTPVALAAGQIQFLSFTPVGSNVTLRTITCVFDQI